MAAVIGLAGVVPRARPRLSPRLGAPVRLGRMARP